MRTLIATLSLLALLLVVPGCLVAAVGAAVGGYAYVSGDLEKDLEAPIDRVYEASVAVINELEYSVKEKAKDALEAHVTAEQADETSVKITLESKGDNLTHVSVRVGTFGDESQSILIMEKIEARLK